MEVLLGECGIRTWRPGDRDALVAAANHRSVWRNLTARFPHPYTAPDAERWLASHTDHPPTTFAVTLDDIPVGAVGGELDPIDGGIMRWGYWYTPAVWGRGLATEAGRWFVDYAFDTFPIRRLEATVFAWNPASRRVLEKLGFSYEGTRRQAIVKDTDVTDELLFSLLRADHEPGAG